MKMKNQKVIEIFASRISRSYYNTSIIESHTGNLYISEGGNRLMNYNTCLAEFTGNTVYINETKYSSTTSKIQNMLKRELEFNRNLTKIHYNKVPMNTDRLV